MLVWGSCCNMQRVRHIWWMRGALVWANLSSRLSHTSLAMVPYMGYAVVQCWISLINYPCSDHGVHLLPMMKVRRSNCRFFLCFHQWNLALSLHAKLFSWNEPNSNSSLLWVAPHKRYPIIRPGRAWWWAEHWKHSSSPFLHFLEANFFFGSPSTSFDAIIKCLKILIWERMFSLLYLHSGITREYIHIRYPSNKPIDIYPTLWDIYV